jgi:acetoin utilization protein AcuC
MKTAYVFSEDFSKFDYGPAHPLKNFRLKLVYELVRAYGLLSLPETRYVEAVAASEEDIASFHNKEYIEILKAADRGSAPSGAGLWGLGPGDNPAFKGLFQWSMLVTGASLQAAELVDSGEVAVAFNPSGGLHHASAARASGFCYVNDPVIAIMSLLKKGRRIAYIDIDAHHGDGVQEAFYGTDRVLTISIHETGRTLFPGTGFEGEIGSGKGKGYSVNVPMPPRADDELFLFAFDQLIPPLIERFRPDIVVSQLGADSFYNDPLSHLNYTSKGFCEAVKRIKAMSHRLVALGGGGYDVANVARAWTLAWAIMNDREIADDIPDDFLKRYPDAGFGSGKIRDHIHPDEADDKEMMRKSIGRAVAWIRKNVFPLIST